MSITGTQQVFTSVASLPPIKVSGTRLAAVWMTGPRQGGTGSGRPATHLMLHGRADVVGGDAAVEHREHPGALDVGSRRRPEPPTV